MTVNFSTAARRIQSPSPVIYYTRFTVSFYKLTFVFFSVCVPLSETTRARTHADNEK